MNFGPIRRWQDGDVHYAENDFIRLAFVYTDDITQLGTGGWHGPDKIWVEYVARPSAAHGQGREEGK